MLARKIRESTDNTSAKYILDGLLAGNAREVESLRHQLTMSRNRELYLLDKIIALEELLVGSSDTEAER